MNTWVCGAWRDGHLRGAHAQAQPGVHRRLELRGARGLDHDLGLLELRDAVLRGRGTESKVGRGGSAQLQGNSP